MTVNTDSPWDFMFDGGLEDHESEIIAVAVDPYGPFDVSDADDTDDAGKTE